MLVKVRFAQGPRITAGRTKNRKLALGFATLLMPGILASWVLVIWRFASDLGFAEAFAIEQGPFAHWQPWVGVALTLHVAVSALNRYARRDQAPAQAETEAA
jgi:hypothetical protein